MSNSSRSQDQSERALFLGIGWRPECLRSGTLRPSPRWGKSVRVRSLHRRRKTMTPRLAGRPPAAGIPQRIRACLAPVRAGGAAALTQPPGHRPGARLRRAVLPAALLAALAGPALADRHCYVGLD